MPKINNEELEELYAYISLYFLSCKQRTEHGFLFKNYFYILRLNEKNNSIDVECLKKSDRFEFIKEFATYSLIQLFEICKPEEKYFIFATPKKGEYFMTSIRKEKMFVKKISSKDLD